MNIYKTTKWQRIRRHQLAIEPLCRACGREAYEVDHIIPVSAGGDPWGGPFQSLCKTCHSKKTGIEQAGGTWHMTGADGYPVGGHWWADDRKSLGADAIDRIANTFSE